MPSTQALAIATEIYNDHAPMLHGGVRATPERLASIIDRHIATPNAALPPLDPTTPRRKMVITIEVAADFEKRLDNQWMVEREIAADRWNWRWASDTPSPHDQA